MDTLECMSESCRPLCFVSGGCCVSRAVRDIALCSCLVRCTLVRSTMPAAADTAEDEGSFTWSENSPVKIVWCCVRVFLQHHVVAASAWGVFLDNTASALPAHRDGQLDVSLITCQVCSFTFYNTEVSCGKDPFLLIICRSAITTFRHSVITVQLLKLLFSWVNAVERLRGVADLAAADICE